MALSSTWCRCFVVSSSAVWLVVTNLRPIFSESVLRRAQRVLHGAQQNADTTAGVIAVRIQKPANLLHIFRTLTKWHRSTLSSLSTQFRVPPPLPRVRKGCRSPSSGVSHAAARHVFTNATSLCDMAVLLTCELDRVSSRDGAPVITEQPA